MGQHQLYTDQLTLDPEYIWQDDAACAFEDPDTFDLIDQFHPKGKGIGHNAIRYMNKKNFEKAAKICGKCPVVESCTESMTDSDREWVFRAGRIPDRYSDTPLGRPKKGDKREGETAFRTCDAGHKRKVGVKRCKECKTEYVRRYRKEVKSGDRVVVPRSEREHDPLDPRLSHRVE